MTDRAFHVSSKWWLIRVCTYIIYIEPRFSLPNFTPLIVFWRNFLVNFSKILYFRPFWVKNLMDLVSTARWSNLRVCMIASKINNNWNLKFSKSFYIWPFLNKNSTNLVRLQSSIDLGKCAIDKTIRTTWKTIRFVCDVKKGFHE